MAETFGGIINREVKDSTPWWPEPNLPDKDLAEHRDRVTGRHRIRASRMFWFPYRHAKF